MLVMMQMMIMMKMIVMMVMINKRNRIVNL